MDGRALDHAVDDQVLVVAAVPAHQLHQQGMGVPPLVMERRGIDALRTIAEGHALDSLAIEVGRNGRVYFLHRDQRGNGLFHERLQSSQQSIPRFVHRLLHVAVAVEEHLDEAVDVDGAATQMRALLAIGHEIDLALPQLGHAGDHVAHIPHHALAKRLFGNPFFALQQANPGNHVLPLPQIVREF